MNKGNITKLEKMISDIHNLDYEEAIIYDKRPYIKIYRGFLVDSQIILSIFFVENKFDLFVIKLSFFSFYFSNKLFFKCLFLYR